MIRAAAYMFVFGMLLVAAPTVALILIALLIITRR